MDINDRFLPQSYQAPPIKEGGIKDILYIPKKAKHYVTSLG